MNRKGNWKSDTDWAAPGAAPASCQQEREREIYTHPAPRTDQACASREGRTAASTTCAYCRVTRPLAGVGVKRTGKKGLRHARIAGQNICNRLQRRRGEV
ncbi:hypothetical protein Hsc_3127 [Herbaspirillum seropedicae]|nr:hypothetical protein Hsc_3127 [Herbaspirillum seropedicae]